MILIKWKLFSLCFINGSKTNYLLDLNHNLYTLKIAETQDEKKKHEQERDFKISAPNKKEVKDENTEDQILRQQCPKNKGPDLGLNAPKFTSEKFHVVRCAWDFELKAILGISRMQGQVQSCYWSCLPSFLTEELGLRFEIAILALVV